MDGLCYFPFSFDDSQRGYPLSSFLYRYLCFAAVIVGEVIGRIARGMMGNAITSHTISITPHTPRDLRAQRDMLPCLKGCDMDVGAVMQDLPSGRH